jgi:Helix-turn-helix domain
VTVVAFARPKPPVSANDQVKVCRALKLLSSEKFVLREMIDLARSNGECFATVPALAQMIGQSVRTVQRALRALEAGGHISVVRLSDGRAGLGTTYRVHPATARVTGDMVAGGTGDIDAPPRVTSTPGTGDNNDAPYIDNLQEEPPRENLQGTGALPLPEPPVAAERQNARREPRRKPRSALPKGWRPSPEAQATARGLGVDVERELAKFTRYHVAHGNLRASWEASWSIWVDKIPNDLRAGPAANGRGSMVEALRQVRAARGTGKVIEGKLFNDE